MRKFTCLLLLIQSGLIMSQSKTVVTPYGEKISISPYANNGLSTNNGFVQLGGALTQPSVLTTTSAFTLAINGLQPGSSSDNVLATDANGVIKYIPRSSFGGGADNLGNHIATQDLDMKKFSILNIWNANIKNEVKILDRVDGNTNYFGIYKNNGILGIWNNNTSSNALAIDENTNKTTIVAAQITKGYDGATPAAGDVAMAYDNNGNVVWRKLAEVSGTSSVQFYIQSTGKSGIGSTAWSNVPGFTNVSYVAPANGDLILESVLYSALDKNPTAGTPAMTNTQMKIIVNGTDTAYGMSTPIGIAGAGKNPACTVMLTKFPVIKGTTYLISIQAQDVWNSNAAGVQGAYVGTFTYLNYSTPSTMMATLITR